MQIPITSVQKEVVSGISRSPLAIFSTVACRGSPSRLQLTDAFRRNLVDMHCTGFAGFRIRRHPSQDGDLIVLCIWKWRVRCALDRFWWGHQMSGSLPGRCIRTPRRARDEQNGGRIEIRRSTLSGRNRWLWDGRGGSERPLGENETSIRLNTADDLRLNTRHASRGIPLSTAVLDTADSC